MKRQDPLLNNLLADPLAHPTRVHELFERRSQIEPDTLVFSTSSGHCITYEAANKAADCLARYLIDTYPVGPDIPVAFCMERGLCLEITRMAILKTGSCFLPLSPHWPTVRCQYVLTEAMCTVVLTEAYFSHNVKDLVGDMVTVDAVDPIAMAKREPRYKELGPAPGSCSNLAYILYTSGTTGRPKGVMITHRSIVNYLVHCAVECEITNKDRELTHTSYTFDVSLDSYIFQIQGALCVLPSAAEEADIRSLMRTVGDWRLTSTFLTPSVLSCFLLPTENPKDRLSTLREIRVGGEAVRTDQIVRTMDTLPGISLRNGYGPTEGSVDVTYLRFYEPGPTSIGRPIHNMEAYILTTNRDFVKPGEEGELYVSGIGLARGYLGRPSLTAEYFVSNPFNRQPLYERMYRTGDLCSWLPNGTISYVGRVDKQVKLRGQRVELTEVEGTILTHTKVEACAVTTVTDSSNMKLLVAIYVGSGTEDELRQFCKQKLPIYAVPSVFVLVDALPVTSHGKLDTSALNDLIAKASKSGYESPQTKEEELLCSLVERVLGAHTHPISRKAHFFHCGGHSLSAAMLAADIQNHFNVKMNALEILKYPHIYELASYVTNKSTQESPIVPLEVKVSGESWWGVDGIYPLAPEQELLWVLGELMGSTVRPNFSLQAKVQWKEQVHVPSMRRACEMLVQRHSALRCKVVRENQGSLQLPADWIPSMVSDAFTQLMTRQGAIPAMAHRILTKVLQSQSSEFRMKILPPSPPYVASHSLANLTNDEAQNDFDKIYNQAATQAFDLENGPLFRCNIVAMPNNTHIVIGTVHHAYVDLVSLDLIMDELEILYRHCRSGVVGEALPAPPMQYHEYAVKQKLEELGPEFNNSLNFWKAHFAGSNHSNIPPEPDLSNTKRHYESTFLLGKGVVSSVANFCKSSNLPVSGIMLAAYYLLLHRLTGHRRVHANVVHGGGPRGVVGYFLHAHFLCMDLTNMENSLELITKCCEQIFQALEHRRASLFKCLCADITIASAVAASKPVCMFQVINVRSRPPSKSFCKPSANTGMTDLLFQVCVTPNLEYYVEVEYNSRHFNYKYIQDLVETYGDILRLLAIRCGEGPLVLLPARHTSAARLCACF